MMYKGITLYARMRTYTHGAIALDGIRYKAKVIV